MFFERIGRFAPPWSGFLAVCFPLFAAAFLWKQQVFLQGEEEHVFMTHQQARSAFAREERAQKFFSLHAHSDPYFLDHQIESLSFLQQEQKLLESWSHHPAICDRKELDERLSFLRSEQNRLVFSETETRISPECKETRETQRHPIEIDETDLKHLLALVEEIPSCTANNRPQLIITNFRLHRKNQAFALETSLLKREFP